MCIAWEKRDSPITIWARWSPLNGPINVLHVTVWRGCAFAAGLGTHMKIGVVGFYLILCPFNKGQREIYLGGHNVKKKNLGGPIAIVYFYLILCPFNQDREPETLGARCKKPKFMGRGSENKFYKFLRNIGFFLTLSGAAKPGSIHAFNPFLSRAFGWKTDTEKLNGPRKAESYPGPAQH